MPGVFHLRNVLEFIIHSLNDSPLPEQQFVGNAHQRTLHVAFQLGNKLYSVHEQPLEETLAYISLIPNQLAVYEFRKVLVFQRLAVVNVTGCYHEVEQLSLLIANQMQFKSEEPAHGAFSPLRYTFEHLMDMDTLIPADTQGSAINEADTSTFPHAVLS